MAYLVHENATKAAVEAGYSKKSAQVQSSQILKDKRVQAVLEAVESELAEQDAEDFAIERVEIILQLWYACTRSLDDFLNEEGVIPQDLTELNDRAKACVNSIDQKCYYDEEGNLTRVDTKLGLVPKEKAVDMAMKHKALYSPERHEHKVAVDFSQLADTEVPDVIEGEVVKEEQGYNQGRLPNRPGPQGTEEEDDAEE